MAFKRFLYFYLSVVIFSLSGHQDAVHHFLHSLNNDHHEINNVSQFQHSEVQSEYHSHCWIDELLQHRSHQIFLTHSLSDSLITRAVQSIQIAKYQFIFKSRNDLSNKARGPPSFIST